MKFKTRILFTAVSSFVLLITGCDKFAPKEHDAEVIERPANIPKNYDYFQGASKEENQKLRIELKRARVPFKESSDTKGIETFSWPKVYTKQVEEMQQKSFGEVPPEERSYQLGEDFQDCLKKKGIPSTVMTWYGMKYVVVSEEDNKKVEKAGCY
jgi:hypothetical protein